MAVPRSPSWQPFTAPTLGAYPPGDTAMSTTPAARSLAALAADYAEGAAS